MSLLANSNAMTAQGGGYTISNSLRFQSASSQYASRTPSVAGNRQTWTWSGWVKRGSLGSDQFLMSAGTTNIGVFGFLAADTFFFNFEYTANAFVTTQVFRDPSAWYHIVVVADSTNATASNRTRLYVNGTQVTAFSSTSYPAQNNLGYININQLHTIGRRSDISSGYFDGYMAEVNFIDGQALTPSSFGLSDPYTGQWEAKKYTGTYGTNGFYLPFSNGTSTVTLGVDYSGNNNNWALNAFTRSAGVSDCWMKDVPSGNGFGGVNASSNYCVLNPLDNNSMTITAANLNAAGSTTYGAVRSSFALSSGKWYYEVDVLQNVSGNLVGIAPMASVFNTTNIYPNALAIDNSTIGGIKTVGVTIDFDNLQCKFYVNNVLSSTQTIVASNAPYSPFVADGSSGNNASYSINFGQRSFAYTPPTGFLPLCTANLPSPTIWQGNKFMDATLYTGDNTNNRSITNASSFRPDLVWIKDRTVANYHILFDSVRGGYALFSNDTLAEVNMSSTYGWTNTAPTTTGFKVDKGTNGAINNSTDAYVGWQWQAGQGTTSSNTQGSITSTVSVNTLSGFSIVTYTGTGANATVGHGLGVAPKMVIVKNRSSALDWCVWHTNLTSGAYSLFLNATNAQTSVPTVWNSTIPTSSVISLGTNNAVNQSTNNMVAYCFAEIAGFSRFGSYTGNGSADGTFVYTGFRPKFVMYKRTDSTGNWFIDDSVRLGYNVVTSDLLAEASNAEANYNGGLDILSNGFKQRATSNGNASGGTYIYMAFAENPFNFSNAR